MLKITFRQLEIFIAIAKAESISIAAETIHLSQSALSMALTALESQLGEKLFDRAGKRLVLNEYGRKILPEAMNIIHQVKMLGTSFLVGKEEELHGNIDIGASTTIGNYLLPALIAKFMKQYHQTQFMLKINNTSQIIQEILKFKIDLGMIEGTCTHPEITSLPWKKDQLVIVAAPKHPLTKKKRINLSDLAQVNWVMREPGSGTREIFEKSIQMKIHSSLQLGNIEAIKQAVATGMGVSCLSQLAVAQAVKNKQLVILKTPFLKLTREFTILFHKKKYKSALLEKFISICRNVKI